MPHIVYILESLSDGTYYVGSTKYLSDRVERHNQDRSRYTKAKRPWKLIYYEEHPEKTRALKRENAIKNRKSRDYIEGLIRASRQT